MIVAAGALHGKAKHATPDSRNHVVQVFVTEFRVILLTEANLGIAAQKARGDQAVIGHCGQFVARDLLAQHGAVGFVLVEGADHVIAVAPGVGAVEIVLKAVGIGVAGHVKPVPPPALAIVGRGEQPLDQFVPGSGRGVVQKLCGFGWCGRQADQVCISAPQQSDAVCFGGALQSFFGESGVDEKVNRVHRRAGQCSLYRRAECPVIAFFGADGGVVQGVGFYGNTGHCALTCGTLLPNGTLIDPEADGFDVFCGKSATNRHGRFFEARHQAIETAFLRIARDQISAVFATF